MISNVFVSGTSPDLYNSNNYIRRYVADGFREQNPDAHVRECTPAEFFRLERLPKNSLCLFVGSVLDLRYNVEAQLATARKRGALALIWLQDDPYEFDMSSRVFGHADAVFTNDKASSYHYPPGSPVFHLPLASPSKQLQAPDSRLGLDFIFAGFPFQNRIDFFRRFNNTRDHKKLDFVGSLIGPSWDVHAFPEAIDLRIDPSTLLRLYASSKSTIYLGRELDLLNRRYQIRASTPGPRLFECAGAGGCQIAMTPGLEILDYFTPEHEFLVVDSPEEAAELVQELRLNVSRSLELGRRAQLRVKSEHLYKHRAERILEVVKDL